jgi:Uma2 family endonuclease
MTDPARKLWTLDEFLAFDDGTVTRYELIGGEIVAMAPRFGTHVALAARLGPSDQARIESPLVQSRRLLRSRH